MPTSRNPRRLRRSESFLGIHFDYHMRPGCRRVGEHVTEKMVERIIDLVRPDYIQIDCKGHPGVASYPTKVGTPADGFARDPLRVWRRATARRGVALYMHYSGVIDGEACRKHPSWAAVTAEGRPHHSVTSVFGPYVDRLLIPQLKELCDEYGVDGVWVDGECWGVERDYHVKVLAEFRRRTGIRNVPRKPTDPHFHEFNEFCREGFRKYLRHYVDAMRRHNPDFQIASNWAFSSFMPEPVSADVDFVSGDYPLQDSVNAARFEARVLARQGKPWDLMAWGFSGAFRQGSYSTKSAVQLKQEAAMVLACGGGFQAYFKQKTDASIYDWQMDVMAEVARFCRARQRVCHCAQAVPQIALLYSSAALYRRMQACFAPWKDIRPESPTSDVLLGLTGVLRALLESQNAVEVLVEHQLAGRMKDYPLIIVPEWGRLDPKFREELLEYVSDGGNLLLVGPESAGLFRKELGVEFIGRPEERSRYLEHDGRLCGMKTLSQPVRLGRGVRPFGRLFAANEPEGPHSPAGSVARYGKGRIAATYLNFGERYRNAHTAVARDYLNAFVRQLFPRPLVEVRGSHCVDVVVNRIDGKLAVNLVNTSGPHADRNVFVYDEVPPVGPLDVLVRTGRRPRSVTLHPGGRKLRYAFAGGEVRLTLPRLELHDIIVIE